MTKMKDTFTLPVKDVGGDLADCREGYLGEFFLVEHSEAAALAINSYDTHVARIKELEEALRGCVQMIDFSINVEQAIYNIPMLDDAKALLNTLNSVKGDK